MINKRNWIWWSELSMNQEDQNSFLTWIPLYLYLASPLHSLSTIFPLSLKNHVFSTAWRSILRVWGETTGLGSRRSGWILSSQICSVMTLSKLPNLSRRWCLSPSPYNLHTHTHTNISESTWGQYVTAAWMPVPACITLKSLASSGRSSTFFSLFP